MDLYKKSNRKIRLEIEGLRAVAALLVAVYHIWLGKVSGGVDVFFVVSGFLITTSLLSQFEKTGKIDLPGFLIRLSKRLFPAAFTVLFTVVIACIFFLPELRWSQTVKEALASALYFQNWMLAQTSVDYLAQNSEASPFQHFWAMSIQGQFYIIWPLLLLISVLLAKYIFKKSVRFSFLIVLSVVLVLSLSYSIYLTSVNQPWAYFDTFTRVWEFSMGGILALIIANISLKKSVSAVLGWMGLIGLVSCGLLLPVSSVFPGFVALWPTLSAVFILLAGNQGGKYGVYSFLSHKSMVTFGGLSYGFYLWHWPLLIFYFAVTGNEKANLLDGIIIILSAILLSYLTTTFIEKPIRNSAKLDTKLKTAKVSLSFLLPVVFLAGGWYFTIKQMQSVEQTSAIPLTEISEEYPGAVSLKDDFNQSVEEGKGFIPRAIQARDDVPRGYKDGCHQKPGDPEVLECKYGSTDNPKYTIALVGGSHSAHWLPALEGVAAKENIMILNYTKSGCRFSDGDVVDDCADWNGELMEILRSKKPDLVFLPADVGANPNEEVPKGYIKKWEELDEANIPVFAVRDNPWPKFDVPSCIDEYGENSKKCLIDRGKAVPKESAWSKLKTPPNNVHYADLSDYFCEEEYCKPIVGNVLVYQDKNHITATYSQTLAPILREYLMPVLEEETGI
ncbi:acyltransferase [Bacillus salacetis]|uniref:Acyltransferase n=1 Tax=Bacillus salacetis TaxID=2315464 RepID=A0A3A1QYD5_9BACI|nr:acyltransferase family protein [Bacillus salacetis]RIW31875.1 acyltransferase [Bacillus salacetis]